MTSNELPLIQWALQQGGITVICIVILFFYRRDWHTTVDAWKEQHNITVELVKSATIAEERTRATLAETNIVIHSLKRAIESAYFGRRQADQIIGNSSDGKVI